MTVLASFDRVYTEALRGRPCRVSGVDVADRLLPVHRWSGPATRSDRLLLGHCVGVTLDVGCGPGRMGAHLRRRGLPVLGVDIVHEAVAQARLRGLAAVQRDVFDPVPGEGAWDTVLLADGNIGIGGDPVGLLRRTTQLLAPGGRVVCDLAPPGTGLVVHRARLLSGERQSGPFRWARVGPEAVRGVARSAGLGVRTLHWRGSRWFAVLSR